MPKKLEGYDDRWELTLDEMKAAMKPGDFVHTFQQVGFAILGCEVERQKLIDRAAHPESLVEIAGDTATRMGHGIALLYPGEPTTYIEGVAPAIPA